MVASAESGMRRLGALISTERERKKTGEVGAGVLEAEHANGKLAIGENSSAFFRFRRRKWQKTSLYRFRPKVT